jgi:misacylated tRNA(Ala) deacylase
MSELLYLSECYLKEFDADVVSCEGKRIVLDRTAFYPESGGQPSDVGEISFSGKTAKIISVKKDAGEVFHEIDSECADFGIAPGSSVRCVIDWEKRYPLMRSHTAAHVLSAVIAREEPSIDITGNQLGIDKSRIDFSMENFDREKIKHYEEEANNEIRKSLPVSISFLPREEAFKIPGLVKLRKMLPESLKTIRVVNIEGLDEQACGGTHIRNISEIKGIEVLSCENKGKSNRRIYFRLKE